jgi:rod shape-determining protein MreD
VAFLVYAGLLALGGLAEATLGHRLELGDGRANLVLLMVVAWSLLRGIEEGALAGLVGGLGLDLVGATPFGLYTALLTVIGAVAAQGEATLYRGSLPLFFGMAVLVTVSYHGAAMLILQAVGWDTPSFAYLVRILVPTVLVNAVLMPIIFALAQRLLRALSGWRQLELE